jgi:hypothetical protein
MPKLEGVVAYQIDGREVSANFSRKRNKKGLYNQSITLLLLYQPFKHQGLPYKKSEPIIYFNPI